MKAGFPITGIILAGGSGRRIGCDKAFLKLGPKTVIEELISRLEKKFPRLIIVANETEKYRKFHHEVISDILPDRGSLGGIYSGLVKSHTFYNFVFAGDAPFVNFALIDYMVNKVEDADIILPKWKGRFEPLCAIYSKNCINPIKEQLDKNDLKITNFFSQLSVKVIEQEEMEKFDLREISFLNINTKEDYDAALKEVKKA